MHRGLLAASLVAVLGLTPQAVAQCAFAQTPPAHIEEPFDHIVVARVDEIGADTPFRMTLSVQNVLKGSLKDGAKVTAAAGDNSTGVCGDSRVKPGQRVLVYLRGDAAKLEYALVLADDATGFQAFERSAELAQKKSSSCSFAPGEAPIGAAGAALALLALAGVARRRRQM